MLNDFSAIKEAFVTRGIEFAGRIDDPRDGIVHRHLPVKGNVITDMLFRWYLKLTRYVSIIK